MWRLLLHFPSKEGVPKVWYTAKGGTLATMYGNTTKTVTTVDFNIRLLNNHSVDHSQIERVGAMYMDLYTLLIWA
jgi:hypothetical protein